MINKSNLGYRDDYDFESIYDSIKTFYPIDDEAQKVSPSPDYPGLVKIGNILRDNFHVQKNYREKWGKFKKYLKKELKKPVEETMNAFHPCYSGFVVLEQTKTDGHTVTKELHFLISLLGPFYAIYGLDKSEISLTDSMPRAAFNLQASSIGTDSDDKRTREYPAYHAMTVSPYMEYQESFRLLEQKIEEYFPGYQFVPNHVCTKKIPGISAFSPDVKEKLKDSIFAALFNPYVNFDIPLRGDSHYGLQKWLKVIEGLEETVMRTKQVMLQNAALVANDKVSLHKVWKFKNFNRLPPNPANGNLLFGMESFDLMDLTNDKAATILSEGKEPTNPSYSVVNNEIHFADNNQVVYKISKLTADELVLRLYFDIQAESGKTIQGDLAEMCFERLETPE